MSNPEGWRVSLGPVDSVMVKTAEDAVKLGQYIGRLTADLGVYMAERERLAAENERLREAGDAMADCVDSDTFPNTIAAWRAAKEGRDAK